MTTDTAALVRQMRDALELIVQWDDAGLAWVDHLIEGAREAIAAADQWLAQPPANQCGETCERAKLCPACALGLTQAETADSLDGGETYHGPERTPEDATGQRRAIDHFVNKPSIANEVIRAVREAAAEREPGLVPKPAPSRPGHRRTRYLRPNAQASAVSGGRSESAACRVGPLGCVAANSC